MPATCLTRPRRLVPVGVMGRRRSYSPSPTIFHSRPSRQLRSSWCRRALMSVMPAIVPAGCDDLVAALFNVAYALYERGDEIVVPAPYWVTYPEHANLADATPVVVQTTAKNRYKMSP